MNESFITGLREPLGVAVDSGHIYWANVPWIGRADLDGQNVNKYFIYAPGYPVGVAVDSGHIYWADNTDSWYGTYTASRPGRAEREPVLHHHRRTFPAGCHGS